MLFQTRATLGAALGLAALSLTTVAEAQTAPADMILHNGKIVTVDDAFSIVQAVAIDDGRFVAVGTSDEVMERSGPDTRVIDLGGRTVIPGLIDSHLHQIRGALNIPKVALIDARSIADVVAAIGARVAETPPGEWVQASSAWHEGTLKEGRLPTRWELDEVSPENPVFIPRGGHVVVVNSKALELAGIDKETKDPPSGVIVRDPETGEATGVLLENATALVEDLLPPPPPAEERLRLLQEFMARLNAFGIVAVTDPGLNDDEIATYRQLREQGDMTVRTGMLYRFRDLESLRHAVETYGPGSGDAMLFMQGLKISLDGGVEGARMNIPYQVVEGEQPDPNFMGVYRLPPGGYDELVEAYRLAAENGWQVTTHAVGGATIDVTVKAYETVNRDVPLSDLRWIVTHIFLPTERAMDSMAEMGILGTVQDHPVLLGHNQRRYWGDPRANYAIPLRTLLDQGIFLGGGTDAPVVPADPFLSIWWMVTRGTLNGYKLGEGQAISVEEALRLYTANNAYILGVEEDQGSIETGKLADIVVLSDDILSIPEDEIREVTAELTLLGGEVVHDSGALEVGAAQ